MTVITFHRSMSALFFLSFLSFLPLTAIAQSISTGSTSGSGESASTLCNYNASTGTVTFSKVISVGTGNRKWPNSSPNSVTIVGAGTGPDNAYYTRIAMIHKVAKSSTTDVGAENSIFCLDSARQALATNATLTIGNPASTSQVSLQNPPSVVAYKTDCPYECCVEILVGNELSTPAFCSLTKP